MATAHSEQKPEQILLTLFQYCHVQDRNTGQIELHEGPKRLKLDGHEDVINTWEKVKLLDGQFAVVLNPWRSRKDQQDHEVGEIHHGEREIRLGPSIFSLHPGEQLEGTGNGVQKQPVLTDSDALLLKFEKEAPNPLKPEENLPAGTRLLLKGPCQYVPHRDIIVLETRQKYSVPQSEGLYVQNNETGEVRLVKGPAEFFLEHHESLWAKLPTNEELIALGYRDQESKENDGRRVLSAAPRPRKINADAVIIDLEDNEVVCLTSDHGSRVEFGPKMIFLEPDERPNILYLSGGVPLKPNVLRIAKLSLGPDFIRDQLHVRTRDNTRLRLDVTFRWRFVISDPPQRLFALKDFVGFSAQVLSSEIREEAAKHDFEEFHARAAELVKLAVFSGNASRVFPENGLEILGVDVENVLPIDDQIAKTLDEAGRIKIAVIAKRTREAAEIESERQLIEGRIQTEIKRRDLIALEARNQQDKAIGAAKAEADALQVRDEAKLKSFKETAAAERADEKAHLEAQAAYFGGPAGQTLIEIEQAKAFRETDKLILPTDAKVQFGIPTRGMVHTVKSET